jgi:flagellar hook-length control protein FliK
LPSTTATGLPAYALQHANWGEALGQHLIQMVQKQAQEAEIKLQPQHLGTLEVRLSVREEQASVSFVCADAGVREAIESSLPKLREMLQDQGVDLGEAHVSAEAQARQRGARDGRPTRHPGEAEPSDDPNALGSAPARANAIAGLVDQYV